MNYKITNKKSTDQQIDALRFQTYHIALLGLSTYFTRFNQA